MIIDNSLLPLPFAPRNPTPRVTPRNAQLLLERYRILAMAMATRAIAVHWDTGLLGHIAGEAVGLPFEQEVLGLIGVSRGRAVEQIQEAERGVVQALQDVTAFEAQLENQLLPLDELAIDFDLSPMTKMLVLLIAAPQLWGSVNQLFRIAANDPSRGPVDEHLLGQLLGPQVNPHLIAQELMRGAPLISGGLVSYDESDHRRPLAPLRVAPLILARLRGDPLETDPENFRAPRPPAPPLAQLIVDDAAVQAITAWAHEPTNTRLVLRGRASSGRTTLAQALAHNAQRRLEILELPSLIGSGDALLPELAQALRRCRLAGWVPCITGFDGLGTTDRERRVLLGKLLDGYDGPLVLRLDAEEQPLIAPGYWNVDLLPLSATQRQEMWRDELATYGLPTDQYAEFAARWRISPGTIHNVVTGVAAAPPAERDVAKLVDRGVNQHLQNRLGDVAERITQLPALADMVLPSDVLDSLKEFVARNRLGQKVYEQWGMDKVATTGRGLTALFQGAPGTGKTMVAGALARELGLDLYRVDLSRILSKWIGETERNLANVFAAAEDGHAIILFDEADSLFTKRTEVKTSNDRHANLEVNYLLQRLDSFIGIAILTTNFGTAIDPAFKRRLSFRLTFPVPDEEIREQLWRKHLPPQLPTGKLDLADLARKFHFAGGAVRNCVLRAAFLAAAEDSVLTQEHLMRAIRLEYRSVGKISEGGPLE